jgi:hypothetical protein
MATTAIALTAPQTTVSDVIVEGFGSSTVAAVALNNVSSTTMRVSNLRLIQPAGIGISVATTFSEVVDCYIFEADSHGISIAGASDCVIARNLINKPGFGTTNTYDGIILSGNSDRNMVAANKVVPASSGNVPRYGVNISAATCDDNVVADNMLVPSGTFGTGSFNDAGTGTITSRDGNGQFT